MSEQQKELIFDLLTKKAVYGLDDAERKQFDDLDAQTIDAEFSSLEITAAAISMVGLDTDEPLPSHLQAKILDEAESFVRSGASEAAPWPPPERPAYQSAPEPSGGSFFGWFGWVAAFAACAALAFNIWSTRFQPPVEVAKAPPVQIPQVLTPAQMRDEMMRSTPSIIKAEWAAGNVKELKEISGDVVWSDAKQAGYMRLRGLPVNDGTKETYQLWIFDKTQDKATPIDGGTFDMPSSGEVVIPINAKLKAAGPEMFAITVEKAGGVVVSKREKIALAKVESPTV
jgi:hypothetical protein